jgi:hypothetical protein
MHNKKKKLHLSDCTTKYLITPLCLREHISQLQSGLFITNVKHLKLICWNPVDTTQAGTVMPHTSLLQFQSSARRSILPEGFTIFY